MKNTRMNRVVAALASTVLLPGIAMRLLLADPASHAAAHPARAALPRSVWDSVYTIDQSMRGDTIYTQICSQCHGAELTGDDDIPPLAGADFIAGWDGKTVGALFTRIKRTMPQDNTVVLSAQQIADVVAYILSYNKFPAGKVELGLDQALLDEIRIDGTRPRSDSRGTHDSQ